MTAPRADLESVPGDTAMQAKWAAILEASHGDIPEELRSLEVRQIRALFTVARSKRTEAQARRKTNLRELVARRQLAESRAFAQAVAAE